MNLLVYHSRTALAVLLTTLAALFLPATAVAQADSESDFKITGHRLNAALCRIEIQVKAVRKGASVALKEEELRIVETIGGRKATSNIDSIAYFVQENVTQETRRDALNVLFLCQADTAKMPRIKSLILRVADELSAAASSNNYFLGVYGRGAPAPEALTDIGNLDAALDAMAANHFNGAALYKGVIEAVRFSKTRKGKWVIFVFTDGVNVENEDSNSAEAPFDMADMLAFLEQLSLNTSVFPIGIGAERNDSSLAGITRATASKADTFVVNTSPRNLPEKVGRRVNILYNNVIYLYTSNPIFDGSERLYNAKWIGGPRGYSDATYSFREGTTINPLALCNAETGADWLYKWLLGLGIVGGALGIFALAIPFADKRNFRDKFVMRYRKEQGITRNDPLTGEPIAEGDWVVIKCPRQVTTLATWEYVGNKCPSYPRCLDFANPCEGHGAPSDTDKFFSGKGIFRRLNWVWFGMVGGFIGWTLFALFKYLGMEWYNDLLFRLYKNFGGNIQTTEEVTALADDTLLGATFGAGICFTLSWAEERSQPRKISWLRIALRTFMGILVSLLVFFLGFYLQYKGYDLTYTAMFTWVLFGLGVGAVLSVESSISLWRGLIGGFLAALLAFCVYLLFGGNFALAKLFSFILMGALLGLTLVTVFARLEDFELEYVSPDMFRQVNPISKWLKKGIDVFIGREPGNHVYVKWEDPAVEPFHARLFYDKGVVYIEPLADTLVNGSLIPLKTNTPLHNGDLIQLGRESISRMRYREKRRAQGTGDPSGRR